MPTSRVELAVGEGAGPVGGDVGEEGEGVGERQPVSSTPPSGSSLSASVAPCTSGVKSGGQDHRARCPPAPRAAEGPDREGDEAGADAQVAVGRAARIEQVEGDRYG